MSRLPRVDAVLVQAVIAGALSFAHLHDIAEAAGQTGWKAWAYPISVDLLLVAAWRRLRTLQAVGSPAGAAWTWFLIALAASLGANIATAGLLDLNDVPDWLRILVAGWPALAFLGGTLLVHSPADGEQAADEVEDQALAVEQVEPFASADPAPAALEPTEVPAPPALESDPVPAPIEQPAPAPAPATPSVPVALVEHARKLSDAHRDRTGAPMDTDTLRARLGVPAPMADAVAAQLT